MINSIKSNDLSQVKKLIQQEEYNRTSDLEYILCALENDRETILELLLENAVQRDIPLDLVELFNLSSNQRVKYNISVLVVALSGILKPTEMVTLFEKTCTLRNAEIAQSFIDELPPKKISFLLYKIISDIAKNNNGKENKEQLEFILTQVIKGNTDQSENSYDIIALFRILYKERLTDNIDLLYDALSRIVNPTDMVTLFEKICTLRNAEMAQSFIGELPPKKLAILLYKIISNIANNNNEKENNDQLNFILNLVIKGSAEQRENGHDVVALFRILFQEGLRDNISILYDALSSIAKPTEMVSLFEKICTLGNAEIAQSFIGELTSRELVRLLSKILSDISTNIDKKKYQAQLNFIITQVIMVNQFGSLLNLAYQHDSTVLSFLKNHEHFKNNFEEILTRMAENGYSSALELLPNSMQSSSFKFKINIMIRFRKDNLTLLSQMIYKNDIFTKIESLPRQKVPKFKVISNNEGYFANGHNNGLPLKLKDGKKETPIGYNIYLPAGKIKAMYVSVYGGFRASDIHEKVHRPSSNRLFGIVQNNLLANNVAVIILNLPDLLMNHKFQGEMLENVHKVIHDSINEFYQTLKQKPNNLHSDIASLDTHNIPIILGGASFGGRTAIRHAEIFPETFDRYVSHHGSLDNEMSMKSDIEPHKNRNKNYELFPWLDPSKHIEKINKPILIIDGLDDNNVNAKVGLSFLTKFKAHSADKSLARYLLTTKGNPASKKNYSDKGHFIPNDKIYIDTLINFVKNGPSLVPEFTDWTVLKGNQIANKNYRSGSLQDKMVSHAFEIYKENHINQPLSQAIWEKMYFPKLRITAFVEHLASSSDDDITKEIARFAECINKDEVIKNTIQYQAPIMLAFFCEILGLQIPSNMSNDDAVEFLKQSEDIIHTTKTMFFDIYKYPSSLRMYLLNSFFNANPEILDAHLQEITMHNIFLSQIEDARKQFF